MISVRKDPLKSDWIYVGVVGGRVHLWSEYKTLRSSVVVDDRAGVLLLVAVV